MSLSYLHNRHSVGGEGAGLVRADGRGVTHRLASVQMPDQVIVGHHFLKSKWQRLETWQAIWTNKRFFFFLASFMSASESMPEIRIRGEGEKMNHYPQKA